MECKYYNLHEDEESSMFIKKTIHFHTSAELQVPWYRSF